MKIPYPQSFSSIGLALLLTFAVIPAKAQETVRIEFADTKGEVVSFEKLKGKTLGFYFSAHWCPPCRQFTPTLVDFRNKNSEDFEVIFVSFDNSKAEKETYMQEASMPWLTVPGHNNREANALAQIFGVRGYPTLVVIDPEGKVITSQGKEDVMFSPDTAIDKWKSIAVASAKKAKS